MGSSIFDKLSLGATNSTVTAFKNLVNDKAGSVKDTVSSIADQASSAINNAASTGNSALNNIKSKGTAVINNSIKSVENSISSAGSLISSNVSSALSTAENQYKKFKQTAESVVTEFDFDLYTKALKLPDCQSISFDRAEGIASDLIGTFTGSNIFKDFEGNVDTSINNAISQIGSQIGKITLDPSSLEYAIFSNNDIAEIISLKDFNPESLISDFSGLYQNLLNDKFSSLENYVSDIKSVGSLLTSFSDYTADDIINNATDKVSSVWNSITGDIYSTIGNFKGSFILESANDTLPIPDSASAILNDIPGIDDEDSSIGTVSEIAKGLSNLTGKTDAINTDNITPKKALSSLVNKESSIDWMHSAQAIINYDGLLHALVCYQQPENVSYSASAQFDSVASRGTQQPFQFYNCANQITLSFNLKWHIDELLLYHSDYKTLQEIAAIAEDFTRPYEVGDSISPKLCTVTLPSLSEVGYITEAQISYSGAMTGDANAESSESDHSLAYVNGASLGERANNTYYQYSNLEVSFQLLVVKDIKLSQDLENQIAAADMVQDGLVAWQSVKTQLTSGVGSAAFKSALNANKQLDFEKNQSVLPEAPSSQKEVLSSNMSDLASYM